MCVQYLFWPIVAHLFLSGHQLGGDDNGDCLPASGVSGNESNSYTLILFISLLLNNSVAIFNHIWYIFNIGYL